jgi:vacuolar-type H+-ATPase subunit I/STV1
VLKFRVTLNSLNGVSRALNEGRGKMKKMMTPFIFEIATKMITAVPVVFGIVVLLTTKALLVGKLALVISVILFFQIFLSGGVSIVLSYIYYS